MDGAPDQSMKHILIIVPVDVAGGGHLAPRDVGVARFRFRRQPARSFRDDLKAARNGIERPQVRLESLVVNTSDKRVCKVDVEDDIRQAKLESLGVKFIRFTEGEVKTDMLNVLRSLEGVIIEIIKSDSSIKLPKGFDLSVLDS